VLHEEPTPLADLVPDCRPEIASICNRALKKDRDERFDSTGAMRDAISRLRSDLDAEAGLTIVSAPAAGAFSPAAPVTNGDTARRDTDGSARQTPGTGPRPTPGTGPRRTDRELLARRRAELLAAELAGGRRLLGEGDVERARESCLRALAIDESNAEALAFEREVEAAAAGEQATSMVAASDLPARASADATSATPALESLPPALSPADDRTVLRPLPQDDHTILRQPRHTPAPAPAPPPAVTQVPPSDARGTTVSDPPLEAGRSSSPSHPPAPPSVKPAPAPTGSRKLLIAGGVVAALVVVAAGFMMSGSPPAPPGTLVIDAVPWARITSIEAEGGTAVQLPANASTPFSLPVPAGTYRIGLEGPPPALARTDITAIVKESTITTVPTQTFQPMTLDDYFGQYLGTREPVPETTTASAEGQP
jgi:hypothetical protein